jgi:hypothetical protein
MNKSLGDIHIIFEATNLLFSSGDLLIITMKPPFPFLLFIGPKSKG